MLPADYSARPLVTGPQQLKRGGIRPHTGVSDFDRAHELDHSRCPRRAKPSALFESQTTHMPDRVPRARGAVGGRDAGLAAVEVDVSYQVVLWVTGWLRDSPVYAVICCINGWGL